MVKVLIAQLTGAQGLCGTEEWEHSHRDECEEHKWEYLGGRQRELSLIHRSKQRRILSPRWRWWKHSLTVL